MITLQKKEGVVDVPDEFMPKELRPYPKDNETAFENWFFKNYDHKRNDSDRIYLPIQYTAYYVNNRHGRDKKALIALQRYMDSLNRKQKYFSVVQYDDGILNKLNGLDLKVFGTGCKGDVQLPLVCTPHKYEFKETGRPIFASFVGQITHPIRQKMVDELQGKEGYFISTEQTGLHSYCYIMSQSKYCLAPRGYGKTSFRIMEALQYGAVPIYFSDEHLFNNGCMKLSSFDFSFIDKLKDSFTDSEAAKRTFEKFYTYEAVAKMIYENL